MPPGAVAGARSVVVDLGAGEFAGTARLELAAGHDVQRALGGGGEQSYEGLVAGRRELERIGSGRQGSIRVPLELESLVDPRQARFGGGVSLQVDLGDQGLVVAPVVR
ncbi:hypothetical protein GCM10008944_32510 [Cytobacillus oceanisediminis]